MCDEAFLADNWGLDGKTAQELYPAAKATREKLGIIDAHTHLSARQIVENEPFPDFLAATLRARDPRWANYDHYVGQALASCGIPHADLLAAPEKYDAKAMWLRAAALFPMFAGNHAYTWAHLELRRTFGINLTINAENAQAIWDAATERLKKDDMRPRAILKRANVKLLCTTDDPLDDLEWHERAAKEVTELKILPSFRPDQATCILKPTFKAYVERATSTLKKPLTLDGLVAAMKERHDFFAAKGCKVTDHGLNGAFGRLVTKEVAEEIFERAMKSAPLNGEDEANFASYMMHHYAEWNKAAHIVMIIHFGALRGANSALVKNHGPDLGADVIARSFRAAEDVSPLLSRFCGKGDGNDLRVVLSPIDPGTYPEVVTLTRAFAGVNQMAPWWFSDTHAGIAAQIEHHIEHGVLSAHFGMVCDGRKLTSIAPRFEMYDRAVCTAVGHMVDRGIVPRSVAPSMVHRLVYGNQARILGFSEDKVLSF